MDDLIRDLVEHAKTVWPELTGGFVAYVLHELHHVLFKRPGRWLVRKLTGKKGATHE